MTEEQAERIATAFGASLDTTTTFFDSCRRDGYTTFKEVEKWIREFESTPPDLAHLIHLRIAWEMGL
jgi:hypothetical protein